MGIAQRQAFIKFPAILGNQKRANLLKLNIKTAGDWLKVKRMEKNLTPGHVAAKMGIATTMICSWESDSRRPDGQQWNRLAQILGFDAMGFEKFASSTP